jgi:hypothetical protein
MEKNADGKLAITRVELHPKITWSANRRPSEEELDKMHHAAHENCFMARQPVCYGPFTKRWTSSMRGCFHRSRPGDRCELPEARIGQHRVALEILQHRRPRLAAPTRSAQRTTPLWQRWISANWPWESASSIWMGRNSSGVILRRRSQVSRPISGACNWSEAHPT